MDEKKGNLNEKTRKRLYDTVYIAFFAALIAVCSWISIPSEVPFTLQTFAVCVSVGLLGGKRGTVAVLVYIFLGLVGGVCGIQRRRCRACGRNRGIYSRLYIYGACYVAV